MNVSERLQVPFPIIRDPDNDNYTISWNLGNTMPFTTADSQGLYFDPSYPGNF
jgi:hypothetical protein